MISRPRPTMSLIPAEMLGQYRILECLALGGMGRVFKAEHVLMKRLVALKMVFVRQLGLGSDSEATASRLIENFYREVQVAARLCHPNIVMTYDAGEVDGEPFLVMEFVDGIDLERLVRESGRLPVRQACEFIRQAALGLQYAYERGVLHCDIKPANLMVKIGADKGSVPFFAQAFTHSAAVKILDLGLARRTMWAGDWEDPPFDGSFCLSGTPDYLAPELAHDPQLRDVRSDLYSLGCTFYFLLSGRVPFPEGTWTEKLLRHQYEAPVPLVQLRPGLPPEVSEIVERLMAKDSAQRLATPGDLAEALGQCLTLDLGGADTFCGSSIAGRCDTPQNLPLEEPTSFTPEAIASPPATDPLPNAAGPSTAPERHSHWELTLEVQPARRSRRLPWFLALCGSVFLGILGGWTLRYLPGVGWEPGNLPLLSAGTSPRALPFVLEQSGRQFASLSQALAEATSGDTLLINGPGPYLVRPLTIRGKDLTLQAAPGSNPCLELIPWGRAELIPHSKAELISLYVPTVQQALLTTDRPLTLRGLELRLRASPRESDSGPGHLVYSQGASLSLHHCRLITQRRAAGVVCRGSPHLEMRACRVESAGLALSLEAANSACDILLAENCLEVQGKGEAALSVWQPELATPLPVRLTLNKNQIRASRILALRRLQGGMSLTAQDNHFIFDEGLLDFTLCGPAEVWPRSTSERAELLPRYTWSGRDNHYTWKRAWIRMEEADVSVASLSNWQTFWNTSEPGSVEERMKEGE